jgi:catechol 2,3-dioxygenase-like lactoylglutathione lyase family enzyme
MATFIKSLVTIYAQDILKAADFYGRLLGLEETYRFPSEGIAEHIEYRIGTTTLAISSPAGLQAHGMPPATLGHPFEIGLKTDDVHAIVQHLSTNGVTILKEPSLSAAGNQYAYIADPDGNWISVYQTMEP